MLNLLKKNEKVIILITLVLLLPFILPLIEIIFKVILNLGRIIGTNMRYVEQGICLK